MASSIYLIVPYQYTVRLQKDSPALSQTNAFDMDPDTTLTITTTSGLTLEFDQYLTAHYAYIRNIQVDEIFAGNNYLAWTDDTGAGVTIVSGFVFSDTGTWTRSVGVSGLQKTSASTGDMNVMVKLSKASSVYQFNTRFVNPSGYTISLENILLGYGYNIPIYNQNYRKELSYRETPFNNKNLVGIKYPNYNSARSNKLIEKHTYTFAWNGANDTTYVNAFKNFFQAFGNTWQPFGFVWVDDNIIDADKSGLFVIESEGVGLHYNESMQEYDLTLTMIKLEA